MKKTIEIEVCDGCEIESEGDEIWYKCTKCNKVYCPECILEHLIDEKLIIEVEIE